MNAITPHRGWTLVECLTATTIIALLAGTAVPQLNHWIADTQQRNTLRAILSACRLARDVALSRRQIVTLCSSSDLIQCDQHWGHQLIVFTDKNKNEAVDAHDEILKIVQLPEQYCLELHASANKQFLQFKPSGLSNGTAGNIHFCEPTQGQNDQKIVVSLGGRSTIRNMN